MASAGGGRHRFHRTHTRRGACVDRAQADAHETLKRYLAVNGVTTTTIAQLRKQQLSLADNSTWVAYNERLFEGLRKAGMPEE